MTSHLGLTQLVQGLGSKNLSLFSVPAAFACALAPHVYAVSSAHVVYNNNNPRDFVDAVARTDKLDPALRDRVLRGKMASDNAFQTIGLFAGGVAAANVAAAVAPGAFDKGLLNALSWGYIASRVVYNLIYITSDSRSTGLGAARTAVWQVGTAIIFTLWIKAGLALL